MNAPQASGYENAPATKMLATFCACCSRPLLDSISVEAGIENAAAVVDDVLDSGVFQDAINEHDCDAGPMLVKSATVRLRRGGSGGRGGAS